MADVDSHADFEDEWDETFVSPEVGPNELEMLARSQLEHALDARRRGLKIYESLKNLNDVIGTQYGDRVLFELLQNAHDAHPQDCQGEIAIRLLIEDESRGELLVANRGRGFTFSNLDAIRNIGTSDKEIGEGIGNKGLGFRSVEALTDDVRVFSQMQSAPSERFSGYCFRFADLGEIETRLKEVGAPSRVSQNIARNIPRYLVPLPVSDQPEHILDLARAGFATVVSLPLRTAASVKLAREQVVALTSAEAPILLFLERLAAVEIEVLEAGLTSIRRRLTRSVLKLQDASVIDGCKLERVELSTGERFLVARRVLPKKDVIAAVTESISAAPPLKRWLKWKGDAVVSVAVPIEGGGVQAPRLFNFLPMDDKAVAPLAGYVDAPFFADIDRRSLKPDLPLNKFLLQAAATTCAAAAITIVQEQLPVSENAIVDLIAWSAPHTSKIRDGFAAIGVPLAKAAIWPIVSGGPERWGSLEHLYAWPDVPTKFLKPTRLAQTLGAAILPGTLGEARTARLRTFASTMSLPITPPTSKLCDWSTQMAEALARSKRFRPRQWGDLYDDLTALFAATGNSLKELEGKAIILGADGRLHPATAAGGDGVPPVFVRMQAKRGRSAGSPPLPPSLLSRRLRFLHDSIVLSEGTLSAFEKTGLIRRYDPVEVLGSLAGALGSAPTASQQREALSWVFRVWRVVGASVEAALADAGLSVPTNKGWYPAHEACFSATWTAAGRLLEPYLLEAADSSPDCAAQRDRLLISFAEWPLAATDDRKGDWIRFLELLGVRDGLHPIAGELRRKGYPSWHWNPLFTSGNAKLGLGELWVQHARSKVLKHPQTEYCMEGECWRLPGQLEHRQLPQAARELLSDLIVAYLREFGDRHFSFDVRHWKNGTDRVTLPTPLAIFLKHGEWVASIRRDEVLLRKPDTCWSSQTPRQVPPRFVERFTVEQSSRSSPLALLFDPRIGLRDWAKADTAPERLRSLAGALADLSAAERRDLRDQLRRAWSDTSASALPLPALLPLVVERLAGLEIYEGSKEAPPPVYITAERHGFAARALVDQGEAVLDVGDADAQVIQKLLEETGSFAPKLADAGNIRLVVDGVDFHPSSSDPYLVAGDREWLADAAMLAHEFLGDAFELRNLPPELVEQKIRQIRLRRCQDFAVEVGGREIAARGRERVQAFPDPRLPTLIVAGSEAVDLELLIEAAPALTKLVGARRNTLETMLSRLARAGFEMGGHRPLDDQFARAVQRDVTIVRDHFAATVGGLERRVRTLIPVVYYLRGRELAEQLSAQYDQLGPMLRLRDWFAHQLGDVVAEHLLNAVEDSDDQASLRRRLSFDFARYNAVLLELGYPALNDEQDFRRLFEVYVNELRPVLLDRVRRRYKGDYERGEDLEAYVGHKSLSFVQFNPDWVYSLEQLERSVVQDHVYAAAERELGPDDNSIALPDLTATLSANKKLVGANHNRTARTIRAWCRKHNCVPPELVEPSDPQPILRALDRAGLLDFERLEAEMLPSLYKRVQAWPDGMQTTLELADLELSEVELDFEEREAREARRQAEIVRRTISFGGTPIDTGDSQFDRLFAELAEAALVKDADWYARSRPPRLRLQEEREPRSSSGGPGGKGKGQSWRDQPPEAIKRAMGVASEYLAREYLRRRHPREMSDDCWVSSNRAAFCTGAAGDDSRGYDFRVVTPRNEWLYEVKSALDEGGEFELTARELEVAGSASLDRKRRYRILYVPFVFDPDRWRVLPIQNPVGEATRNRFRVIRAGSVRYAFDRK